MTVMYVDAEALNLRKEPNSNTDNRIGSLFLTQRVEILDSDAPEGWAKVKANIEEKSCVGYVSTRYLREPLSTNREALIASVNTEFMRFRRGLGKENVQPYAKYVGEMWKAIGNDNLDGTDTGVPWSAAAISFMVRNAGDAYKNFKFAAAHSKFVHHAIQAKKKKDKSAPFWGYRLDEVRPQIGDIVVRDNPDVAPNVNFDVAAASDSYRSHSDIVVCIQSDKQRLLAIGGNLSHSVSVAIYPLASGDYLSDEKHAFAVLRNRTDD